MNRRDFIKAGGSAFTLRPPVRFSVRNAVEEDVPVRGWLRTERTTAMVLL